MAGKLSFSIAINLLTQNFKAGANYVKSAFRSMQMQVLSFAAALGAGGIGLSNLVSRFVQVARYTNRVNTALKNVSGSTTQYVYNMRFLLDMAKKYGLEINALTSNFAKFTAAASVSNMSMAEQKKIFESVSRAVTAFGMSSEDSNGVFLALSQMMSKGKISSEELRLQMGERLPIALQAMAKAAGTSVAGLDKLLKQGKLMSADVLPKFAKALDEMIPNIDTDNLETSVNRLKNVFTDLVNSMDIQGKYKSIVDWLTNALDVLKGKLNAVFAAIATFFSGKLLSSIYGYFKKSWIYIDTTVGKVRIAEEQKLLATEKRIEAQKVYERTLSDFEAINNGKRLASARQLAQAKSALEKASLREKKAIDNLKIASEQAAAVKTTGIWSKVFTSIKIGFSNAGKAMKAFFMASWPMALLSALSAVVGYFKSAYDEAKRIKNIFSDYKKEAASISMPLESAQLKELLRLYDKASGNSKLQEQYQRRIESILGTQIRQNQNINDLVKDRIKLLEATAKAEFYTQKKVVAQDKINELGKKAGLNGISQGNFDYMMQYMASYNRTGSDKDLQIAINEYAEHIRKNGGKFVENYDDLLLEISGYWEAARDSSIEIEKAMKLAVEKSPQKTTITSETNDKLKRAEEDYAQSIRELNARRKVEGMTVDEYNKAYSELNKKALISAMASGDKDIVNSNFTKRLAQEYSRSMQDIIASTSSAILDDIQKELERDEKSITIEATPILGKRDTRFDYKKSDMDILGEEIELLKKYRDDLQQAVVEGNETLANDLDNAIKNVDSLEDKLAIAQVKKDIKDLSDELSESLYSGIKNIASSSDRVVSAFQNLKDVLSDVDASGWEKIMAVWNMIINTTDTVMSAIKTIENISAIVKKLSDAEGATEDPVESAGATVAAKTAEVAANAVATEIELKASERKTEAAATEMAAKSTAAYAGIPFIGAGLAAGQIAAMTAMIEAAAMNVPKFANGGIITGGLTTGDKILVRANGGEMMLNQRQQSNLFKAINSGNIGKGRELHSTVSTNVRAKDLILTINNQLKSEGKKPIS